MLGRMREIFVCGEECQVVPDGQLCKQCIDGADLNTRLAACVSQNRSTDVIVSIGLKQRQGGKALDDLGLGFGSRETLQ
jgi:hypothetical protein